ncbi:MAG: hypothetical protein ACU0CA_09180 [Paracoccaceae bacterium]
MRTLFALITLLFTLPAMAQDDTTIRSYYEPEGDIFIGQTVRLWVEITTTGKITTPPQYPELKVEGAISLLPESGAVSFSDGPRIGLRQRYVIIPQRPGPITVPPLQIDIGTDLDGTTTLQTLSVIPDPVQAIIPPGTESFDRIVTTSDLNVSESYDNPLTDLKTGDAITRTITTVAGGTFALALPAITFEQISNAKQYLATPQLSDKTNRGQYNATRIDAATYVFEKAGDTTLPEITVQWFDPKSNAVKETILPAVDLTIVVNPAYAETTASSATEDTKTRLLHQLGKALVWLQDNIAKITLLAIGLYLLHLIWARYSPTVRKALQDRREKILHSEKYAFNQFKKACASGDTTQCRTAFWRWLDHFVPPDQSASLTAISAKNPKLDTTNLSKYLSSNPLHKDNLGAFKSAATTLRSDLLDPPAKSTKRYTLNPRHP